MNVALFFVLVLFGISQAALQCRDENNKPVDWYVMYKVPLIRNSKNALLKSGLAYAYITSQNISQGWVLSTKSINDSNSMPGHTLRQLFYFRRNRNPLLWIQYNDQPPNGVVTDWLGHTKGTVMSGKAGGFWLVHSVPHYPPSPWSTKLYSYPKTGQHNGQSFLCISLDASQLERVGTQLMYNQPNIYSSYVPPTLEDKLPNLASAARSKRVRSPPWNCKQEIVSLAGQQFVSFAKAGKFNKELYADWVAPTLEATLLVESWMNGVGKLSSSCHGPFQVENISSLSVKAAGVHFNTTHDHSKWAVAENDNHSADNWVCIGDINRMENQETRGGGTVCINHYKLWSAYREIIQSVEACPSRL